MGYEELKEIYYKNREQYEEIYKSRFLSEQATIINFDINGNQAFFVIEKDVFNLMIRILKLQKECQILELDLPRVAINQYTRKCLIDEIMLTNNIEGVHSSRKEINEVLDVLEEQSAKRGKKYSFKGLVNKYYKLSKKEIVPLNDCRDIRYIYDEIVLEEIVKENPDNNPDGEIFRKDLSEVYGDTNKVIHKGVYPESKIIQTVSQALEFLNNETVEPLCRACIFHYLLEYIHPFYDGNGRLGRFILSYNISQELHPLLAYRISATIKENIKKYYKAFSACNDPKNKGDVTPFLIMMLTMLNDSSEQLKESLIERKVRLETYLKAIPELEQHDKLGNLYDVLIQAALFSETGISSKELLAFLKITYATLNKRLKVVSDQKLLQMNKRGKEKYYQIKLDLLDEIIEKTIGN